MCASNNFFDEKYLSLMLKTTPANNGMGCILYTGSKARADGYISIKIQYPPGGTKHHSTVHRFIYSLYHHISNLQDILGLEVSHICHNKTCVNIHHLQLGYYQINKVMEVSNL